jgi:diadenosine tetraphosphate (Ap4A) HIT family hydrolase
MNSGDVLACTFCGKLQKDVAKLIAGEKSLICSECVSLCNEIIAEGVDADFSGGVPAMGRLDASWRGEYIERATAAERDPGASPGCVFCGLLGSGRPDAATHIITRTGPVFAILNAYPYTSGHLMCMPLRHVASLDELRTDEQAALWQLVREATVAMTKAYAPEGMNVGINLGRAAGAGVPGHLHVHIVPRWNGDTNFMTAVAEVRVVPESLDISWRKLHDSWPR